MNDQTLTELLRRVARLERDSVRYRGGKAVALEPLSVSLGDSDVAYNDVATINQVEENDHIAALVWGNDMLVLGPFAKGGISRPARATTAPARNSTDIITAELEPAAAESGAVTLAQGFRVLQVASSKPCWLRLYTTPGQRDADASRDISQAPTGNHGVIMEAVFTDAILTLDMLPVPAGFSLEDPPSAAIAYSVVNTDDTAGAVIISLTWQVLEG